MNVNWSRIGACRFVAMGVLIVAAVRAGAGPLQASACQKVVLAGEVSAGQEWRSALGGGWVFRVLPIKPGQPGYSGWDLVMDREQGAGFPDALLLATPPFNSINEREVGTDVWVARPGCDRLEPAQLSFHLQRRRLSGNAEALPVA